MSAEIIKRLPGYTLWRRRDAEGRDQYTYSRDRDGVAVEPIGGWVYSRRMAEQLREEYAQFLRRDFLPFPA